MNFGGRDVDEAGSGAPLELFGIAAPSVANIDVTAQGVTTRALLVGNGWYWSAPTGSIAMSDVKVVAHLSNGRSVATG